MSSEKERMSEGEMREEAVKPGCKDGGAKKGNRITQSLHHCLVYLCVLIYLRPHTHTQMSFYNCEDTYLHYAFPVYLPNLILTAF